VPTHNHLPAIIRSDALQKKSFQTTDNLRADKTTYAFF